MFDELDKNKNGLISGDEIKAVLDQHDPARSSMEMEFLKELCTTVEAGGRLDLQAFTKVVDELRVARVRGERVQWVRTLGLEAELARFLPVGDLYDGLRPLREMQVDERSKRLAEACERFATRLPLLLQAAALKLVGEESVSGGDAQNSKFAIDGGPIGSFASLEDFYEGPEKLIGTPNPHVEEGIQKEHRARSTARKYFTTTNYGVRTTPSLEYQFVTKADPEASYPSCPADKSLWKVPLGEAWKGDCGRNVEPLERFMQIPLFKEAGLETAELIALRLYTGPMFIAYNAALRKFPKDLFEALEGNMYETTIFCISSAITKLAKLTPVPVGHLFRGLLPEEFCKKGPDGLA